MTREKAIKKLKDILEEATETDDSVCYVTADDADALKAAINSLEYEQIEPCEDAISRQAVLDAIEDDNRNGHYSCFASNNDAQCFKGVIGELPSVNPQEPKTDVLDKIKDEIIDKYMTATGDVNTVAKGCLKIIDKYKAESEDNEL